MLNLFSANEDFKKYERMVKLAQTAQLSDYIKVYSVFQYDRKKFRKILDRARTLLMPQTEAELYALQKKIIKRCYILGDAGLPVRLSDSPHIYRYKTLYKFYKALYKALGFNEFSNVESVKIEGIRLFKTLYDDKNYEYRGQSFKGQRFLEYGAEIIGSENLSIKDRVKAHIKLLRLLRRGCKVKISVL